MKRGTAKQVLEFAGTFVGYTESPPGSNCTRFGVAYGMDCVPWCAEFVWFVLTEENVPAIKSAYTPTVAQWYKDQGRGFADESKIRPGDLLFFDFPDSTPRIQHIAFATSRWTDFHNVNTVEGNTSSGSAGSQDNGGVVANRVRGAPEIVYIGRPEYADHEELPRFELPKARTFLRIGDKGADVKTLQRDLNAWMHDLREARGDRLDFDFGKIDVSGEFGPETKKALITFQMQHHRVEPDGLFGRETERVIEAVRKRQES